MRGYKFELWQAVEHGGKFSHYVMRSRVVHAETALAARAEVETYLKKGHAIPDHAIVVDDEFVYSCKDLGAVGYKVEVVYSDGALD